MDQENKIEIKSWQAVGVWRWNIKDDRCAIDRQSLFGQCLECEANQVQDECKIVQGLCNHGFHKHCIDRWLKQSNTCPLCNKEWSDSKIL
ncbi:unnamed protein product [Paramecium sonneborni]|uniref:RING-type domain-containing protein n=1 Tax=Paramecium sonneborni TaxID=65129 RepID=A0A8S1LK05_9CILI|nr:unnamed protein product [Paramecium sonneborni]